MGQIVRVSMCLSAVLFVASRITLSTTLAQTPGMRVSTLKLTNPSTATRVEMAIESLAKSKGWSYENESCEELRKRWSSSERVAILTTPDCLDGFEPARASAISPNIGLPVHFFARKSDGHTTKVLREQARFGMIQSAALNYGVPLKNAIKALLGTEVSVAEYPNYMDLVLAPHDKVDVIAVIDDGTGAKLAAFQKVARSAGIGVEEIFTPSIQLPPARNVPITGFTLPARYLTELRRDDGRSEVPAVAAAAAEPVVLAFTIQKVDAGEPPDDAQSSIVGWIHFHGTAYAAEGKERSARALPAVSPILLTKGDVDRDLLETVRLALLAAPMDGWINPCQGERQEVYRSFVRAAMSPTMPAAQADLVAAALWEQARLLENRERNPVSGRETTYLEANFLDNAARERMVSRFIGEPELGQCPLPDRMLFVFATGKLAFYKQARKLLRDALSAATLDTSSRDFKNAAACLRKAFRQRDGATPDCGKFSYGMWTNVYAPYLPMSIIETEAHHAPHP